MYGNTKSATIVSMLAGESLDGDIYEILTVENDGGVAKVVKSTAATQVIVGVLAEDLGSTLAADGKVVPVYTIAHGGIIPMKAGHAVTAGEIAVSYGATTPGTIDGVANLGALGVDQMGIGIILESGVAGDIVSVLAMPIAAPHTA